MCHAATDGCGFSDGPPHCSEAVFRFDLRHLEQKGFTDKRVLAGKVSRPPSKIPRPPHSFFTDQDARGVGRLVGTADVSHDLRTKAVGPP